MASLDTVRKDLAASGQWFTGTDILPTAEPHLALIAHTREDLSDEFLKTALGRYGVGVEVFGKDEKYPNVYRVMLLVFADESYEDMTPEIAESILNAELVVVQKEKFDLTGSGIDLRELEDRIEDLKPSGDLMAYSPQAVLPTNTWMYLGLVKLGPKRSEIGLTGGKICEDLERAGYKCYPPNDGIQGALWGSSNWEDEDMVKVLFNPGDNQVTVESLASSVFSSPSYYNPPNWDVQVEIWNTRSLQTVLQLSTDVLYSSRSVEGSLKKTANNFVDTARNVGTATKAVAYFPYVALGGAALFGVVWFARSLEKKER